MLRNLAIALLVLVSQGAIAESWYQVEVLIFARTTPSSGELWNASGQPRYDTNAITLTNPEETGADPAVVAEGGWQPLPRDQKVLRYMMERMEGTGKYQPIFHQAWRQPIGSKAETRPVYIQGDQSIPTDDGAVPEVEGTLHFRKAGYLHVAPRIWFNTRYDGQRFYVDIQGEQRLKLKEVNYFDHPLFGMLVRVTE